MQLAHYLGLLHKAERDLAAAYRELASGHAAEADVFHICNQLAEECDSHAEKLKSFVDRYGEDAPAEPDRLHSEIFQGSREGGLGLLRDLQDAYLMAAESDITWTLIGQAAQGARDNDLLAVVNSCEGQTATQMKWLKTRMKQAAPQVLVAQ